MMKSKNIITLTLMISSIMLLIILQVFWLHNTYEKAFFDFRRETSTIFRNTTLEVRDSMLLKSMVSVSSDSVDEFIHPSLPAKHFSASHWKTETQAAKRIAISEDHANVRIIVNSAHDTIQKDILGPLTTQIASLQLKTPGTQKSFVLRLSPDTLNIDTLEMYFRKSLLKEGIDARFTVRHREFTPEFQERILPRIMEGDSWPEKPHVVNVFSDTLHTDPVRINPLHRYSASVSGMREIILKQISPQVFFSIFLTLITTVSFVFMYRNIRSQQRLMESKNEFISNVSHELKTPVATVSVALEALKNFSAMQNPKLTEEYLDIALRELARLSGMTDKILNASLIESHGLTFEPENVNLDLVVREMLASMKLVFEKRQALVNYTTSGSHFEVKGSVLHLTNVVFNLVDNALKYSPEKPTIEILLSCNDQNIRLIVRDNGIGIPSQYQSRVFEKFFRVPSGDIHNIKGYGLGLSYVASVIKSHGGEIHLESDAGKGSSFIIDLPQRNLQQGSI
ncbi:sensor histidine kinase [Pseudochryseolinea flava]|nr:HAMP domain-containing sensor histidine kinase [Pseudochryseolinea flava]